MSKRSAIAVAAVASAFLLAVPTAVGGTVTKTLNFPLAGSSTTNIFDLGPKTCCEIDIDVFGEHLGGNISAELVLNMDTSLSAPTHSDLTFTDTNLKQGRTLDLTNTYSRNSGGKLDVNYILAFHLQAYGLHFDPSLTEGDTLGCSVPLTTETCSHTKDIDLFDFTLLDVGLGSVDVRFSLPITTTASLSGPGVSSDRTMSAAGNPILGPDTLLFTSDPFVKDESTKLSCSLPAGQPVNYAMNTATSAVGGAVQESVGVAVSLVASPIVGPDFTLAGPFTLISEDVPAVDIETINVSAPGQNVDLGNLLPNDVAPTVAMGAIPTNGTEGSPIQLQVAGTGPGGSLSPCGDELDIKWAFDDGGSAYGKIINHAWADNFLGSPAPPHTGSVTVTDPTGLSKTMDFSVPVANVAPAVSAGPDKTQYWGLPVAFHGNGSDAGSTDNGILLYSWDFGDPNSPIGAVGQDVSHVYGSPRVAPYVATATVKDNDGATGAGNVNVNIVKRDTTTSYTGGTSFVVTDAGTLRASVADAIVIGSLGGRSVDFYVDGVVVGSSATNNAGIADLAYTFPLGTVGSHCVVAAFAGDALYNASHSMGACGSGGTTVSVAQNQSALTYTGPLTSSPSKSVTLTARLTDDLGRPLAGKAVNFTLGNQTCNGQMTNASGNVSCTITKLTQNPGSYLFAASYAGDANYIGSSVNTVFKIGPK